MRKILSVALCFSVLCILTAPCLAVDSYYFTSATVDDFYIREPSVAYTVTAPELDARYGLPDETPRNAPGQGDVAFNLPLVGNVGMETGAVFYPDFPVFSSLTTPQYSLTPIEDVRNKDGSIGTLKIPKIGLTVTAYDGDTFEAMKKGIGHIVSSSCWNSNIGLVGHNRGVNDYFGKLKDLKTGDAMTYTTTLGTRIYTVVFAGEIANNDWSYLQYTTDNRLTLITCVADHPEYRYCVQAVEKK